MHVLKMTNLTIKPVRRRIIKYEWENLKHCIWRRAFLWKNRWLFPHEIHRIRFPTVTSLQTTYDSITRKIFLPPFIGTVTSQPLIPSNKHSLCSENGRRWERRKRKGEGIQTLDRPFLILSLPRVCAESSAMLAAIVHGGESLPCSGLFLSTTCSKIVRVSHDALMLSDAVEEVSRNHLESREQSHA